MSDDDIENDIDIDFDEDGGFGDDAAFDDFNTSSGNTLADLWRNNPMVKIGSVLAGLALIVGLGILFGGKKEQPDDFKLRKAPEAEVTDRSDEVVLPAKLREEIERRNEVRAEEAIEQQTSALPIDVDPARSLLKPDLEDQPEEDPLEIWRQMQEQRQRARPQPSQPEPVVQPQQPQVDTRAQAVDQLAKAMAAQMESILESQEVPEMQVEEITSVKWLKEKVVEHEEKLEEEREEAAARAAAAAGEGEEIILIPAGTIEYAQTITEANTDAPGPVLVQLASGPLKGAKLIGSFESTENFLILKFSMIVIDGVNYETDAVALDPGTANPGVITEIDRRYFRRVILPAAAEFVEGVASAVAQSESTTVTVEGGTTSSTEEDLDLNQELATGVESLGSEIGDALDEEADRLEPLLRLAAGTPVGILFVQPVVDEE